MTGSALGLPGVMDVASGAEPNIHMGEVQKGGDRTSDLVFILGFFLQFKRFQIVHHVRDLGSRGSTGTHLGSLWVQLR